MDPQLTDRSGFSRLNDKKDLWRLSRRTGALTFIENYWLGRVYSDIHPSVASVPRLFPGDKARYFPLVCFQRQ